MIPAFVRALQITEQITVEATVQALAEALKALHGATEVFVGAAVPRFSLGKSLPDRGRYVMLVGSLARPIQLTEPAHLEAAVLEEGRFLVQIAERWVDALTQVEHISRSLEDASSRDTLTGVLNRRSFLSSASQRLVVAQAEKRSVALLLLDVCDFSEINAALGHELGDELLFEVASGIRRQLREHDLVARMEGDQFVVLLDQISSPESVERVANRIVSCLEGVPVDLWRGIRLGAALSSGAAGSLATLMSRASEALSEAKAASQPAAYRL